MRADIILAVVESLHSTRTEFLFILLISMRFLYLNEDNFFPISCSFISLFPGGQFFWDENPYAMFSLLASLVVTCCFIALLCVSLPIILLIYLLWHNDCVQIRGIGNSRREHIQSLKLPASTEENTFRFLVVFCAARCVFFLSYSWPLGPLHFKTLFSPRFVSITNKIAPVFKKTIKFLRKFGKIISLIEDASVSELWNSFLVSTELIGQN